MFNILTAFFQIQIFAITFDLGIWGLSGIKTAVPQDICKPQHVHISIGDRLDDRNVVWATKQRCSHCLVRYSQNPMVLDEIASAVDYSIFGSSNENGLQHLYRLTLKGLQPNSTYFYMPVCNGSHSGQFYFKVPPSGMNGSIDLLMLGDLGSKSLLINSLVNEAVTGQYTAIFHFGDFAYDFRDEGGKVGDTFMELMEPAISKVPYMTCPGNHEIDFDSFAHYRHRFAMPGSDWPIPLSKMWYSFDLGPVHFISYSTEVFFTNNRWFVAHQRDWLIQDLQKANSDSIRKETPWIIAYGHRPLYCSANTMDDCTKDESLVRDGLEEIFYNFQVDVIIQAHEHNYERLWPMYKGSVTGYSYTNPVAPIQLITGAGGSREGVDHFNNTKKPVWSAFRLDDSSYHSYGRMLIANKSHILWEQHSAANHNVLDSIWIVKTFFVTRLPVKTLKTATVTNEHSTFSTTLMMSIGFLLFVILLIFIVAIVSRNRH